MPANVSVKSFIEKNWFRDFGQGLALTASRCRDCRRVFFPPKVVCPNCFDGELETVPLSRKGRLHAFAQCHMGPADMEKPYLIGFIDLPEGIKLFSVLTECEPWPEVLQVGLEMEMVLGVIKHDPDGQAIYSYKFKPAL
ncbi:MAG: OB-fold domain-containing protein [Thermodesulfobacteriota bacterium]